MADTNNAAKWYVLHTYSGYENKVANSIQTIVELRSLQDLICEVRIPMETVTEIKNGEEVQVERKLFPGYVLINMVVNDDTWILIRGIRGVADLESESNLAQINARLLPGLETVFLMTKPEHACVSSSAVREAALFGGDFSSFVPASIYADVKAHFNTNN